MRGSLYIIDTMEADAASKRSRTSESAVNDKGEVSSPLDLLRTELLESIDLHAKQQAAQAVSANAALKTSMVDTVLSGATSLIRQSEEKMDKKITDLSISVAACETAADYLREEQKKQAIMVGKMQSVLGVMEEAQPMREAFDDSNFMRNIDASILRVNLLAECSKIQLDTALRAWLAEADCEDNSKAELVGNAKGLRFILQFKGAAGFAGRNARKAKTMLRNRDGTWKTFSVTTIDGEVTDKVFIDFDKNPQQLKRERDGKKLLFVLKENYPDKRFRYDKADGFFSIFGKPLATIDAQPDDFPSSVKWNAVCAIENGINRETIASQFAQKAQTAASRARDVSWTTACV